MTDSLGLKIAVELTFKEEPIHDKSRHYTTQVAYWLGQMTWLSTQLERVISGTSDPLSRPVFRSRAEEEQWSLAISIERSDHTDAVRANQGLFYNRPRRL